MRFHVGGIVGICVPQYGGVNREVVGDCRVCNWTYDESTKGTECPGPPVIEE